MKIYGKNILLLLINIFQFFLHLFIKVDREKIFYLPVNLKKNGNAFSLLSEWSRMHSFKHYYLTSEQDFEPNKKIYFLKFGIKAIFHYSTSKYVVRESEFSSIGLLPRSETTYVQLWHAAGAFKKMALDVKNRSWLVKMGRIRDIRSWSFLFCSSNALVDIYSSAFHNFDKNKIIVAGLPRNDQLFQLKDKRDEIRKNIKVSSNKKLVLYAPTFREDSKATGCSEDVKFIRSFSRSLPEDFVFGIRLHPTMVDFYDSCDGVINFNNCNVEDAMVSADILITDYSSIIFDFSLLEKPMLFYVPDFNHYYDDRGFYFKYEEFVPGPICYKYDELVNHIVGIENYPWKEKVINFRALYNPYFDGKNSYNVLKQILNCHSDTK